MNWSALTSMITALTALGALVFTGLSLNATRDQVAIAQAQNKVSEQGQFTDRNTKAVEQLDKVGADHLQARLGAVYSLERLTRDSPRDQRTITEVLSAFIRSSTPQPTTPSDMDSCPDRPPTVDIQAAIDVLTRRETAHDVGLAVDLRGACLRRVNLTGARFGGAVFDGANLTGAILDATDLSAGSLTTATLSDASMKFTILTGTNLNGANLSGARPTSASFKFALLIPDPPMS